MRWLLFIVLLAACPRPAAPPDAGPKLSPFWSWFAAEQDHLADGVVENPEATVELIQQHLSQHEPGLVADISLGKHQLGPHGLVISADGRRELFPRVRQLVGSAPPKLQRWELIAFRPRHLAELPVNPDGGGLQPKDFTFREVGREGGKLHLEVAIAGLAPDNHEVMVRAAFMLMQAALGELTTEERLGDVDFTPATTPPAPGFKPLSELPAVVDAMK